MKKSNDRDVAASNAAQTALSNPARAFRNFLREHFWMRLHMTLILACVALSGVLASKLLLVLGVQVMVHRYLLAVSCSYAVFFLLVRVWLWYVAVSAGIKEMAAELRSPDPADSSKCQVN